MSPHGQQQEEKGDDGLGAVEDPHQAQADGQEEEVIGEEGLEALTKEYQWPISMPQICNW
jgi:hypothetical protein